MTKDIWWFSMMLTFFFLVRFLPGDYQYETACDDENRPWLSYADSCQWKLITLLLSHATAILLAFWLQEIQA